VNFIYGNNVDRLERLNMSRSYGIVLCFSLLAFLGACRAETASGLKVIKTGDNYQILIGQLPESSKSLSGKMALEIKVVGNWKLNKPAPLIVDLKIPADLEIKKNKLRKSDLKLIENKRCRFEIPYKASKKGTYKVDLKFDFVLCNDTLCQKKRFELSYKLSI